MPTRHYLFLDPETDVPWEQERFNELFRSLRKATAELAETDATATAWPSHIPYRNARLMHDLHGGPKSLLELDAPHLDPSRPDLSARVVEASRAWLVAQGAMTALEGAG